MNSEGEVANTWPEAPPQRSAWQLGDSVSTMNKSDNAFGSKPFIRQNLATGRRANRVC